MQQRNFVKWRVGTVTDLRFRVIAEQAGTPVYVVICVWAVILEHTVSTGKIKLDLAYASRLLQVDVELLQRIMAGLERRNLIAAGRVVNWNRYAGSKKRLCQLLWAPIRARIFARDNYTCQYCGANGVRLECDHVVPLSRGGSNDDDNLATACVPCNRSKGGKLLEEWREAA